MIWRLRRQWRRTWRLLYRRSYAPPDTLAQGIRCWATSHDEYESSTTTRVDDVRHDLFVCRRCKRIRVGGPTDKALCA